jgi:hypothetical protein
MIPDGVGRTVGMENRPLRLRMDDRPARRILLPAGALGGHEDDILLPRQDGEG